ncbi:MAG: adenylate/guanylate cyclase domain-containing protein [Burkholderiales bacterium]|nr:adenylate/guanylate cyclase domain-containing protein [Burkholderiales bacterium]
MTTATLPIQGLAAQAGRHFFTHSGHVPLVLLILEALLSHWGFYREPDPYLLVAAGAAQAWAAVLLEARGRPMPFLSNLVGPLLYSVVEVALEGTGFFSQWHHLAYWGFALAFGVVQSLPARAPVVMAENVLRSSVPLVMYALFEANLQGTGPSLDSFMADRAHAFLATVLLLLGVLLGLADLNLRRSIATIASLTARLRQYSQWALGGAMLDRAIADEGVLALQRAERAVLFMDIRGFTAWSERQSPEDVVDMLNGYYHAAEQAAAPYRPLRMKFTADEVMAVFADPAHALQAARAMLGAARSCLGDQLEVGCGVHYGALVQGVLGGESSRGFDFIGDTVNTAQRLCDAAGGGELLASVQACSAAGTPATHTRHVQAKGKRGGIEAAVLGPAEGPARVEDGIGLSPQPEA